MSVATYESFGLSLKDDRTGKNATGDCPFCGKEDHFNVSKAKGKEGQYRCLKCGEKGNLYTFLQKIYNQLLNDTKQRDYKALVELRGGGSFKNFANHGLAFDRENDTWYIPVKNPQGSLANLRKWRIPEDGKKSPLMSPPDCQLHLYLADEINATGPIFVCEGEWDAISLRWLLTEVGVADFSVVAVPGCDIFKEEWLKLFQNRDVILLYDNDEGGRRGMLTATKKLTSIARSIRCINWPSSVEDKYDIRDYVNDHSGAPGKAWQNLQKLFSQGKVVTKLSRETFKEVVKDFKKVMHFKQSYEEALAVMLAVVFSTRVPGDPLWMFLVGPPGSGKSLLMKAFGDAQQHCEYVSKLSAHAFVSGYKTEDGSDPSLLGRIQNKTLLIKDYTAIKAMPLQVQEELYGILRDAYDGRVDVPFGNGQNKSYRDVWFSLIAGVTDIIHGDNRAALGERFLKIELLDDAELDHDEHIRAAIMDNIADSSKNEALLRDSVSAFLSRTLIAEKLQKPNLKFYDRVIALANVVSYLRAVVARSQGDLTYRPSREIGTRVASQLKRLGQMLAFVYDSKIDDRIYDLVRRVALDTSIGWNLELIAAIMEFPAGLTTQETADRIQVSRDHALKKLTDLMEIGAVYRQLEDTGIPGGKTYRWKASDDLAKNWKKAELHTVKNLISVHHHPVRNKPRGPYKAKGNAHAPSRKGHKVSTPRNKQTRPSRNLVRKRA